MLVLGDGAGLELETPLTRKLIEDIRHTLESWQLFAVLCDSQRPELQRLCRHSSVSTRAVSPGSEGDWRL